MDSVRCPMCGKPNPPDTVICQYCQARLEPLIAPPSPEDSPPPDDDASLPSWLDGLREPDEGEPGEELDEREALKEDTTGWSIEEEARLTSAFSNSVEGEAEQDQDWLSRLVADEPEQAGQGEAEKAGESGSSLPASSAFLSMDELLGEEGSSDWLAEFQTSSLGLEEPDEPSQAQDAPESTPEETPHWLQMLRAEQETESPVEAGPIDKTDLHESSAGSPDQEPETDWLSDVGLDEGADDLTINSKGLPDWMVEAQPIEQEQEPPDGGSIPGWLTESELVQDEHSQPEGEDLPDWLGVGEEHQASPAPVPEKELPEWLSGIESSELPEPVESDAEQVTAAGEDSSLPDWLTRLDASGTYQPPASDSPALILEDEDQAGEVEMEDALETAPEADYTAVPDWLSQISSQEEQVVAATPAQDELEPDLAEAQLPSWLQAMRPVESAAPSAPSEQDQSGTVEQVGPLAGLSGVLAAEPEFIHIRKPQSSLVKLQVSDNQQSHITLLENLLAEEGQAKPVIARSAIPSQYFLRLLIALVVLISVILPLWLNRQILPMPDPASVPNEVYEFGRQIGGLPSGAPVLVAFDYEPGFSAEIDAGAASVLSEMVGRGIQLATVSTHPTGPLLAERFARNQLADSGTDLVNLGYVPGGAGGLLAFAQSPSTVVPFDLHGMRVWETAPWNTVSSLADFGAVIVLTENPDTARSWIEQAQPILGPANKPLLMVLSAQAEPMVRPYYETYPRQVSGMISGLAGGAAFESISGESGLSRLYWDAFGGGLIIAVGLILVGGLVSLVLALLAQPQKQEVEGAL